MMIYKIKIHPSILAIKLNAMFENVVTFEIDFKNKHIFLLDSHGTEVIKLQDIKQTSINNISYQVVKRELVSKLKAINSYTADMIVNTDNVLLVFETKNEQTTYYADHTPAKTHKATLGIKEPNTNFFKQLLNILKGN